MLLNPFYVPRGKKVFNFGAKMYYNTSCTYLEYQSHLFVPIPKKLPNVKSMPMKNKANLDY